MSDHQHHHHDHNHGHPHGHEMPAAPTVEDAGSRALSDALRSSFIVVRIVMAVLVLVFISSGIRTIDPQHKAIILRFGKPVGEGDKALLEPGLHWAFPAPIDEVVTIPYSKVQEVTSTVGWYATTPQQEATKSEPPPGPSLNPGSDGYVMTADANIIHVRATIRYRIADPVRYIFEFSNAPSIVTNALNNAVVYAAAQYTVDDALTGDVTGFRDKIHNRLQQLIDQQQLGIEIEPPTIRAIPPRQLTQAFQQVSLAAVQSDKALNEARSYQNEVVSRSRSEAAARINAGEAERTRLVESVVADARKFEALLPEYQSNPQLFTHLRQVDTLQRVMTNAQEKIFVPSRIDGKSRELRLQISREPPKPNVQQ
jgi:membrane protease subunit HflK